MTPSTFPLIESLGLSVSESTLVVGFSGRKEYSVRASDLERVLSEGVRVEAEAIKSGLWCTKEKWLVHYGNKPVYSALLINIKPIAPPERRREVGENEVIKCMCEYMAKYFPDRETKFIASEAANALFNPKSQSGGGGV
jgi:hypothetical protein